MTIVKDGTVGARAADASVASVAATAVSVDALAEQGLGLILHHAGVDRLHDRLVSLAAHLDDVAHELNLELGLLDTAFLKDGEEGSLQVQTSDHN